MVTTRATMIPASTPDWRMTMKKPPTKNTRTTKMKTEKKRKAARTTTRKLQSVVQRIK